MRVRARHGHRQRQVRRGKGRSREPLLYCTATDVAAAFPARGPSPAHAPTTPAAPPTGETASEQSLSGAGDQQVPVAPQLMPRWWGRPAGLWDGRGGRHRGWQCGGGRLSTSMTGHETARRAGGRLAGLPVGSHGADRRGGRVATPPWLGKAAAAAAATHLPPHCRPPFPPSLPPPPIPPPAPPVPPHLCWR